METPNRNNDALEKSIRRQNSGRANTTIAGTARRIQASPLRNDASSAADVNPAEFQEWMKMVRMKRVKMNNAFAIQLIDAFHDMVQGDILGESDLGFGSRLVNFQEASHTLGGCVTVYRNRIAKVKDDTTKLIEEFGRKMRRREENDDSENDESDEDEENAPTTRRKKPRPEKRLGDENMCLLPPEKLEIDTAELATTIDPLLRKMAADFDKRGAAALLEFALKLNDEGRLYLGTGEAQEEEQAEEEHKGLQPIDEVDEELLAREMAEEAPSAEPAAETGEEGSENRTKADALDLAQFNVDFFSSSSIARRDVLPLVNSIARAVSDPVETDRFVNDLRAWAMADPGNDSTWQKIDAEIDADADAEVDLEGLGIDLDGGLEFDDPANDDLVNDGTVDANGEEMSLASVISNRMPTSGEWMDIGKLQALDAGQNVWGGLGLWRANNKKLYRERRAAAAAALEERRAHGGLRNARRERATAPTFVDFRSDAAAVDLNALNAGGSRTMTLKKQQLESRHVLPKEFNVATSDLTSLSLRPNTGMACAFRRGAWRQPREEATFDNLGDDAFSDAAEPAQAAQDFNDDYFHAGWEEPAPTTAAELFPQSEAGSGSGPLNYARTAKRIDLKRLKNNVWNAIHLDSERASSHQEAEDQEAEDQEAEDDEPRAEFHAPHSLIHIIKETKPLYTEQEQSDLSPALYFVSLLHLSNEKGLTLQNTESLTDVLIDTHAH